MDMFQLGIEKIGIGELQGQAKSIQNKHYVPKLEKDPKNT